MAKDKRQEKQEEQLSSILSSRYWQREDARVVLSALEESGLSAGRFARQYGIRRERLRRWRRNLRMSDPPEMESEEAFVPLQLGMGPTGFFNEESSGVEVIVREGIQIRVRCGFDESTLFRVLAVVEGRSC